MTAQPNPYAPPTARVEDIVSTGSEAEAIRLEHIKHEGSIRSIGALYYLGGGMTIIGGVALLASIPAVGAAHYVWLLAPLYIALGVLSFGLARGIRALRPWARTLSIILSAIGLLAFPVGTLINAYIIWLLVSKKGKRIFQEDYPAIVAATPEIKYRTSVLVWIFLGIIVLGIGAAIVIPMLAGK